MSDTKHPWSRASAWYDERPVRERGLIMATVAVLVLLAGWQFWIEPALVTAERHEAQLADVRSEHAQLLATQTQLEQQLAQDPSAQLRQTLEARQRRLDRIDQQITETTGQLIPPRDMVVMLQDMLATEKAVAGRCTVIGAAADIRTGAVRNPGRRRTGSAALRPRGRYRGVRWLS